VTVEEEIWDEWILGDGLRIRVLHRGVFDEGRVFYLRIYGAPSRHYARTVALKFGKILESDEAEDGAQSFAVAMAVGA
jgi:hypothetical protein